jgi:DNA-binding FrmR family transcriptional regulator
MKKIEHRVNIIIGQLEGIKKMMKNEDCNCFDKIIQLKAVRSGVSSLINKMLEGEIEKCFSKKCPDEKEGIKKLMSEILKN